MATVTATFTPNGTTGTDTLVLAPNNSAALTIARTGSSAFAVRLLERKGAAWEVIETLRADVTARAVPNLTREARYLRVDSVDVGTGNSIAITLADASGDAIGAPILNGAGETVFAVTDAGVSTKGLTASGDATVGGTLQVTGVTTLAAAPVLTATTQVGAAAGIATASSGLGVFKTVLTISGALTVTDALAYAGTKIFDFPEGRLYVLGAIGSMQFGITTDPTTTINASAAMDWSVGTATASATTLATTMVDLIPKVDAPLAAAQTTLNTATTGTLAAAAFFDGTGTAKDAFLNVAFPTDTEIDADGTLNCVGTITILWGIVGDV